MVDKDEYNRADKESSREIKITDTTLRDAHQSLWATRMRLQDILPVLELIDKVGYYSIEAWGGATFDVCLRFLREDPWERLRTIKKHCPVTPLQMLLRGQNIVGYKNYPDDLVDRFIALAIKNGIDIFRVFDALNDTRNLEQTIKSIIKHGAHAQGTICYTISPVHTVELFVRVAKELVEMGVESICIKDMAGILSPKQAYELTKAIVREINVPVQLHSHMTSGMATTVYLEGIFAGARAVDCCVSPLSCFSSQPPVESVISILKEYGFTVNVDMEVLRKVREYFESIAEIRHKCYRPVNPIDPDILIHHIPGGMISNLRSQLMQQNAIDRLPEVLEEIPRVRADLGYPPLVTPTSQIVGIQAVLNVLSGERYSMVPEETRNYVKGLYGRPPAPISPEVMHKILGKEKPIVCRPADLLEPALPGATLEIDPVYIKSEEDIISYCLFPQQAEEFFKWRNLPPDQRLLPPVEEELKEMEQDVKGQKREKITDLTKAVNVPFFTSEDYKRLQEVIKVMSELGISEVRIRKGEEEIGIEASTECKVSPKEVKEEGKEKDKERIEIKNPTIDAPLNGTFYRTSAPGKPPLVKEGDIVEAGQVICIIEAMKLFNQIKTFSKCRIVRFLVEHGSNVKKGQPLVEIESV